MSSNLEAGKTAEAQADLKRLEEAACGPLALIRFQSVAHGVLDSLALRSITTSFKRSM
jgi:hypothetical protein